MSWLGLLRGEDSWRDDTVHESHEESPTNHGDVSQAVDRIKMFSKVDAII